MTLHEKHADRTLTSTVIEHVSEFSPARVNEEARAWTKRCILDLFGTMLAASSPQYSAGSILERFVYREGGHPVASLVGRGLRTAPTLAALFNGMLAYYCDSEPHHPETVMHALATVMPAALAAGEAERANGEAVLTASVLGVDLACRLSAALDPKALYRRGFHPTSVAGCFGAAAAAGYLLGLNQEQWSNAFGLAALQACGLLSWASDPTEHSRSLNPGLAARNGVTAATLADLGYGGPSDVLEGKFDVFKAFSGTRHIERLTDGLGSHLLVTEMAIKLYASCAFLHPGLDALRALMVGASLNIQDIEGIDLRFASSGAGIIDNNELKSHNAQYILSVAALRGTVTIDDILMDRLTHPDVARLARNVSVVYDDELDKTYPRQYSSIVIVRTRDGRRLQKRVDTPKGYPKTPPTDPELMQKYLSMATQQCTNEQAMHIAELTLDIDKLDDIRTLGAALSLDEPT